MSRKRSLAVAVVAALAALPAAAQVPAEKADSLETVIVTGTRVTDRTVAESAAPIDIITPEALEATGTVELATALARVLPSLNFPRPAISDGTDAVKPAQLRGLAPDQVLVLVNGKRRHTTALINLNDSQGRGSSPVDLNAIPIASIARVEVLRDGASAQYGSDAIAGVVNIVLKGSGSGGGFSARYGEYSAGDGDTYQMSGDAGFAFGERGFVHLAGQAGHNDQTDRARAYTGAPGAAAPPYDRVVQRYGDPEIDQGAISYNGEFGFGERATLYSFGMASNRDALSNGFFRPAGDPRNIPEIYPNGFLPNIHNVARDRSLVAGLRGLLGADWNYDLSYNYGYNKLSFDIENTLNRSLGPSSPRQFYAGSLEVTQNVANLDFTKPIEAGFLKYPITFAFGAEWREEKFNQSPGELGSYVDGDGPVNTPPGAQVFPGFKPEDAGHRDRDSRSFYADLEADLTDRFSAAIAARHEDYSDFGTTTSGKFSARYAFTGAVALRGTVSSGFRAPSLQQQYFQSTATNFIGGVPFDVRTFAVDNPTAIALGAEPLKAEESMNYGLGLVLSPAEGLYVTVDAYRIDIDDRIILSENLIGPAVTAFLETRGIFGVTAGAISPMRSIPRPRAWISSAPTSGCCPPAKSTGLSATTIPRPRSRKSRRTRPSSRPAASICSALAGWSRGALPWARRATRSCWGRCGRPATGASPARPRATAGSARSMPARRWTRPLARSGRWISPLPTSSTPGTSPWAPTTSSTPIRTSTISPLPTAASCHTRATRRSASTAPSSTPRWAIAGIDRGRAGCAAVHPALRAGPCVLRKK
jgi:iron complex outermembrane recepter protein